MQARKTLQQASLIQFHDKLAVVLATIEGLQVWDISMQQQQQQLFQWDMQPGPTPHTTPPASFCRGIALVVTEDAASLLCIGSSTGTIHTFAAGSANQLCHSYDLCHHTSPITALASGHTSSITSSSGSSNLASCDENGTIMVFRANTAGMFESKHNWEGHGIPCVAAAFKDEILIAAFCDGSVRLYNLVRPAPQQSPDLTYD